MKKWSLALAAGAAQAGSAALGTTVLYVNGSLSTGTNNGSSWANAYRGADALQRALDAAGPLAGAGATVQMWVAQGTYAPTVLVTQGQALSATFQTISHEEIYGGFAGTESSLDQRGQDTSAHAVTLSGVVASGNVWHVVTMNNADATCIVDRVTVSGGQAYNNAGSPEANGGGVLLHASSPIIRDCVITGNSAGPFVSPISHGGGIYSNTGSPQLLRCAFSQNGAQDGGGFYGNATLSYCTFTGNGGGGNSDAGGLHGVCTLEHCSFQGNHAEGGGALEGTIVATDCTFTSNLAGTGDPIGIISGTSSFTRCLFQNNSAEQGLIDGGGADFADCTFIGDTTSLGGIGPGPGHHLVNCVFLNCQGSPLVSVGDGSSVINCTFLTSVPPPNFAISVSGAATIANSILWGLPEASEIHVLSGPLTLSHSCVQGLTGTLGGTRNFSADPRLAADGSVSANSPCIDAGDSIVVPAGITTDVAGNARFVDDAGMPNNGVGSPPVDVGAFEFQGVTCYGNCDGSTAAPVLNVADFTCFFQAFATGSPYANCDGSSGNPILNVQDFTCFLQKFAVGCQ